MLTVLLPAFENESKWDVVICIYTNESRISVSVSVLETPAERLINIKVPLTHHIIKCAPHKLCFTSMFCSDCFQFLWWWQSCYIVISSIFYITDVQDDYFSIYFKFVVAFFTLAPFSQRDQCGTVVPQVHPSAWKCHRRDGGSTTRQGFHVLSAECMCEQLAQRRKTSESVYNLLRWNPRFRIPCYITGSKWLLLSWYSAHKVLLIVYVKLHHWCVTAYLKWGHCPACK